MDHPDFSAIEEALRIAKMPSHAAPAHAAKVDPVKGIDFPGGLIKAPVHGRTDKIPLNIPSGSYVLPADIVSAMGQGNTDAGAAAIQEVMKDAPYHANHGAYGTDPSATNHGAGNPGVHMGGLPSPPPAMTTTSMEWKPQAQKTGGKTPAASPMVPIIAAGGEVVVRPHEVRWIGDGDLDKGHRWLDKFVIETRKKHRETLAKLAPPKRD